MSGSTFSIGSVGVAVVCAIFFYPDAPVRAPVPAAAPVVAAPPAAPAAPAALPPEPAKPLPLAANARGL